MTSIPAATPAPQAPHLQSVQGGLPNSAEIQLHHAIERARQVSDAGPTQKEYYFHLHNFLEELDFNEAPPPQWLFDYYLSREDEDEERYNQWQNQTQGQTDGISADGDEHLVEEWIHQQRNETPHCQLVDQCESWPCQEPFWQGAPIHCSYTQVDIPYETLPQLEGQGGDKPVYFKEGDLVSMAIGRSGCHLKQLTENYGLHYVWYQPNPLGLEQPTLADGRFELWGRTERLGEAAEALWTHLAMTIYDIWEEWKAYESEPSDCEGEWECCSDSDVEWECCSDSGAESDCFSDSACRNSCGRVRHPQTQPPQKWIQLTSEEGAVYWYNQQTGRTEHDAEDVYSEAESTSIRDDRLY